MTKIKAMSLYFKLCRNGKLNRLSGAFTSISFLTIIVQLLWPTPQNVCPMSSVILIQPTISLEIPVPSQGHCGVPSLPIAK
jgi:hypothetical protein